MTDVGRGFQPRREPALKGPAYIPPASPKTLQNLIRAPICKRRGYTNRDATPKDEA